MLPYPPHTRRFFPALAKLLTCAPLVLGTLPLPRTGRLVAEVRALADVHESRAACLSLGAKWFWDRPHTWPHLQQVEAVRERADVEVVHVTRGNRDQLAGELAQWLRQHLGTGSGQHAER